MCGASGVHALACTSVPFSFARICAAPLWDPLLAGRLPSEFFMPASGTTNDEKDVALRYLLIAGADERLGWLGADKARFGV